MISQSTIDRVRAIPIYDVVSQFIELKKTGSSFRGRSPWGEEKTPSFYVVPDRNFWKDFSSGKGGDAIRFVMEFEKVNYPEAIKLICQKTGEPLEYDQVSPEDQKFKEDLEVLYGLLAATAKRYYDQLNRLASEHEAWAEINRRQFSKDTILQWQIGFAPGGNSEGYSPDEWRFLTEIIVEKGLVDPAVKCGIVTNKNETFYDTFRNRIMFPIHNHQGRVVAFGGRSLVKDEVNPKYINTSDTPLYKKDHTLFGLHFAEHALRKVRYAYLMEGYTDVISFHQAGYNVAVGVCGTSFSSEQSRLLKRYCDKVVLFPDPDAAGMKSAARTIDILLQTGFQTELVTMPNMDGRKIDPDELTRHFGSQIQKPEEVTLIPN